MTTLTSHSEKACRRCGEQKPLESYYRHDKMSDGHLNICKGCAKARSRENRAKKLDYYRDYDRKRYARDGVRGAPNTEARKCQREWRRRNPEKVAAHNAVQRALRRGTLLRPTACQTCGEPGPVQAHHDDYSKPLHVRWLCASCHTVADGRAVEKLAPDTVITTVGRGHALPDEAVHQ